MEKLQVAHNRSCVEIGYNVIKGTEYRLIVVKMSVVLAEECDVMVNSVELIGTTERLTL